MQPNIPPYNPQPPQQTTPQQPQPPQFQPPQIQQTLPLKKKSHTKLIVAVTTLQTLFTIFAGGMLVFGIPYMIRLPSNNLAKDISSKIEQIPGVESVSYTVELHNIAYDMRIGIEIVGKPDQSIDATSSTLKEIDDSIIPRLEEKTRKLAEISVKYSQKNHKSELKVERSEDQLLYRDTSTSALNLSLGAASPMLNTLFAEMDRGAIIAEAIVDNSCNLTFDGSISEEEINELLLYPIDSSNGCKKLTRS